MASFDYKKEYKDLYLPGKTPAIIDVVLMRFIMVNGKGDPNASVFYKEALEVLYGLTYSIKMSKMKDMQPEGYFDYVGRVSMNWNEAFDVDHKPLLEDVREYLREAKSRWDELTVYIEEAYRVKPETAYSKCSAQPGWNVKYKKSSKSLCTLYPMRDYFVALLVVGTKEENEVRMGMDAGIYTNYVKELYDKTVFSAMGKWLMIEVKDKSVLDDIKQLLNIRVKPKMK